MLKLLVVGALAAAAFLGYTELVAEDPPAWPGPSQRDVRTPDPFVNGEPGRSDGIVVPY